MKDLKFYKNKGILAIKNLGISKAEVEWIAFLDSDDYTNDKLIYCNNFGNNNVDLFIMI